ncbi:MAG: nickel-dependent lactate racemase, partial [Caldilineales bacterium]|nr:nickel-dependent lactate racemase [Caldilineales bacterium]
MRVRLAYGRQGLEVDLPPQTQVIAPRFVPGLEDEPAALRAALRRPIAAPPLADLVKPGDTVVIVHTDITRATPNDRILPILLEELEHAGVRRRDITLLNGLGTHRRQTEAELRAMLGDAIVETYRCLQHDCFDDANLVSLGVTSFGHPVRINRTYMEADVKILTGFIEPHFFAGFSGGPKAILPSLAGAESVFTNHGRDMIAHPRATWGVTEGNPIWEEMREVALRTRPTFLLNVTLNTRRQITGVFAGDMLQAHAAGCAFVREHAMAPVDGAFDIVITTNSGYPLSLIHI